MDFGAATSPRRRSVQRPHRGVPERRPPPHYLDQEYAGRLLFALKPPCPLDIAATIKRVLPTWDYSVEQLPQYFDAAVGRERVLEALDALGSCCSSEEEQRAIETFRYWLRVFNSDGTAASTR